MGGTMSRGFARRALGAFTGAVVLAASPAAGQSFGEIDSAVRRGIEQGLYPGAVVVIGRRDTVLLARGYGRLTWQAASPVPQVDSTVWDLASISKVIGTTSAVMRLVDAGKVKLDAPVARYLPRFKGRGKARVTVRMLLDHTSGLKPYVYFYRLTRSRARAIALLSAQPLSRTPGDSAEYSDLNALLLGLLVERVGGAPLDRVVQREVFTPLGLRQTRYRPPRSWLGRVAPSGVWRGQPVAGTVNDRNAELFGGAAGHAGVFGTGRDLAHYAQVWLRQGRTASGPWVQPETVRQFLTRTPRSGTRMLGWDTPDTTLAGTAEPSVFGSLLSPDAYGHTGWTGTEIWIDPVHDLFLVFLTNRSFDPKVSGSIEQLRLVRAELSDAAARLVPRVCGQVLVARC
jgi:CubicO group peptidase (beta-lactamase class C family)